MCVHEHSGIRDLAQAKTTHTQAALTLSTRFMSAPCSSSSRAMSVWPWKAAFINAVRPSCRTTRGACSMCAHEHSGIRDLEQVKITHTQAALTLSARSRSAPRSSSSRTMSVWPWKVARINAVNPYYRTQHKVSQQLRKAGAQRQAATRHLHGGPCPHPGACPGPAAAAPRPPGHWWPPRTAAPPPSLALCAAVL